MDEIELDKEILKKSYRKSWGEANVKKTRAYNKKSYKKNGSKNRAYSRAYYHANKKEVSRME